MDVLFVDDEVISFCYLVFLLTVRLLFCRTAGGPLQTPFTWVPPAPGVSPVEATEQQRWQPASSSGSSVPEGHQSDGQWECSCIRCLVTPAGGSYPVKRHGIRDLLNEALWLSHSGGVCCAGENSTHLECQYSSEAAWGKTMSSHQWRLWPPLPPGAQSQIRLLFLNPWLELLKFLQGGHILCGGMG